MRFFGLLIQGLYHEKMGGWTFRTRTFRTPDFSCPVSTFLSVNDNVIQTFYGKKQITISVFMNKNYYQTR